MEKKKNKLQSDVLTNWATSVYLNKGWMAFIHRQSPTHRLDLLRLIFYFYFLFIYFFLCVCVCVSFLSCFYFYRFSTLTFTWGSTWGKLLSIMACLSASLHCLTFNYYDILRTWTCPLPHTISRSPFTNSPFLYISTYILPICFSTVAASILRCRLHLYIVDQTTSYLTWWAVQTVSYSGRKMNWNLIWKAVIYYCSQAVCCHASCRLAL